MAWNDILRHLNIKKHANDQANLLNVWWFSFAFFCCFFLFSVSLFSAEILAALLITTTTRRRKKVVFCFAVVELHRRWALIKRRLTKRVMKNAKWSENICFIDMTNRRASPTHITTDSTAKTATRFSCVSRTIASLEGGSIHIVRTIKDFEEKSCSADRAASL